MRSARTVLARALILLLLLAIGQSSGAAGQEAEPPGYEETINRPDLHQGHADILRLYWAYFARQPDDLGSDFWIEAYNSCDWGSGRISQFFSESPEFLERFGGQSDNDFVGLIYTNVLGRQPDAGGLAYWLDRLALGEARGSMVASFAFSAEFRLSHPLPSDGRANTGCAGARALDFFRSTEPICRAWGETVGNRPPEPFRFRDATISTVRSPSQVVLRDGAGDLLVVDFEFALDELHRFGSTEPTVVYPVEGPAAVLPLVYSFGCPHYLYLGSAHD